MSLNYETKPFNIHRLVNYFGSSGSDSTIDKRSAEKSCEHYDRDVSR